MLYACEFAWYPGTTREDVARRVVRQHHVGMNNPERIRGWFNLVGGGAGLLLVNYDDPKAVTAFLQPSMDLMSFDVRALTENDYVATIAELRELVNRDVATL